MTGGDGVQTKCPYGLGVEDTLALVENCMACAATQRQRWRDHDAQHDHETKQVKRLVTATTWLTVTAVCSLIVSILAIVAALFVP